MYDIRVCMQGPIKSSEAGTNVSERWHKVCARGLERFCGEGE
jgi:hypothetical protein